MKIKLTAKQSMAVFMRASVAKARICSSTKILLSKEVCPSLKEEWSKEFERENQILSDILIKFIL